MRGANTNFRIVIYEMSSDMYDEVLKDNIISVKRATDRLSLTCSLRCAMMSKSSCKSEWPLCCARPLLLPDQAQHSMPLLLRLGSVNDPGAARGHRMYKRYIKNTVLKKKFRTT